MSRLSLVEQVDHRISAWKMAYDVIRDELTTPQARQVLATLKTRDPYPDEDPGDYLRNQLAVSQTLASLIAANDRTAAAVAGQITNQGLKAPSDYE